VVAVVEDLFFTVKIHDAAKRAALSVEFVKSEIDALQKAAEESPVLMIVDLNASSVDALKLIRTLKSGEATSAIPLLAYVSHVQGDLKVQAQEAGCDMVLAKSAFSQNIQQILQRHAAE